MIKVFFIYKLKIKEILIHRIQDIILTKLEVSARMCVFVDN